MFNPARTNGMAQQRRTRAQWRRLVEDWPDSGLTQEQYCRRHGISVASLHRWRERLRQERAVGFGHGRAREAAEPVRLVPVDLLAAQLPSAGVEATLRLVFAGDLCLEIAPGFDAPTLRRVVELLREPARA
jgi:transposase-like protein